ncbi:MAG TPA: amidohydrolase family protein [Dehalococcoidia bacterium]
MRIDVHAHLIPESVFDVLPDTTRLTFGLPASDGRTQPPNQGGSFEALQLYDIGRRLRDMEDQMVDMQVLSVPPGPMFFSRLPEAEAVAACRRVNDAFAETVSADREHFAAIATVPVQSPQAAAAELERAVRDLGLRGCEINSNVNGANLDDKALAPFYARAQALDVPIFIHPAGVPGLGERLGSYYLGNLIGNPMDTTIAAASLIFGGVFAEFPRLKVYLAHGGGACPYILGRWEHGWHVRGEGKANINRPPSEYFRSLYFDSLVHSGSALSFLASTVGPERVMLGTDYPFDMGNYNSVKAIEGVGGVTDAGKEMMLGGNAATLFGIW